METCADVTIDVDSYCQKALPRVEYTVRHYNTYLEAVLAEIEADLQDDQTELYKAIDNSVWDFVSSLPEA